MRVIDGDKYISLTEAKVQGISITDDTLLYFDHPKYGFDSCSELKFNRQSIANREDEFFIKIALATTK